MTSFLKNEHLAPMVRVTLVASEDVVMCRRLLTTQCGRCKLRKRTFTVRVKEFDAMTANASIH